MCKKLLRNAKSCQRLALEHVQVMADWDDWFLEKVHSCGALFLGLRIDAASGNKVIGTDHRSSTQ